MKSILVTGSSRGIGKAIATLAHKQGYKVIVHGKSDSDELKAVHKQLQGSVKAVFDVSDKEATHSALLSSYMANTSASLIVDTCWYSLQIWFKSSFVIIL